MLRCIVIMQHSLHKKKALEAHRNCSVSMIRKCPVGLSLFIFANNNLKVKRFLKAQLIKKLFP